MRIHFLIAVVVLALAVVDVDARHQLAGQLPRLALGETVIGPRPLGVALDETGIDQKLQVPGNAGLRLAEDRREILDRVLPIGEQSEQPEASLLARCTQHPDPGG